MGVTLICLYIRRLRPFWGFKILNFNIFGVFRKMNIFFLFLFFFFWGGGGGGLGGGGYEDFVDIFRIAASMSTVPSYLPAYLAACVPIGLCSGLLTIVITDSPHLKYVGWQTDRQTDRHIHNLSNISCHICIKVFCCGWNQMTCFKERNLVLLYFSIYYQTLFRVLSAGVLSLYTPGCRLKAYKSQTISKLP